MLKNTRREGRPIVADPDSGFRTKNIKKNTAEIIYISILDPKIAIYSVLIPRPP